jgi:hypothetical protein
MTMLASAERDLNSDIRITHPQAWQPSAWDYSVLSASTGSIAAAPRRHQPCREAELRVDDSGALHTDQSL